MALPNPPRISEEEYLAREEASNFRHEFINGYPVMMAGASAAHIRIHGNLSRILGNALRGGPCEAFGSDMRVRVPEVRNYFYPDLTVACDPLAFAPDSQVAILLNPVLIVEVLSASTETYDRTTKYENYIQLPSLYSYLLVAQDQPRMELLSRAANWQPHIAKGLTATLQLPALGVTLALAEVYERVAF